jgi:hypothetical protein
MKRKLSEVCPSKADRKSALPSSLLGQIADARTLNQAFEQLLRDGPHVPGSDGIGFAAVTPDRRPHFLQELGRLILSSAYRPGPEKVFSVGRGRRRISYPLQNFRDRVIQQAVALAFEPVLASHLADPWIAHLPGARSHLILALAEDCCSRQKRNLWVIGTIHDLPGSIRSKLATKLVQAYVRAPDVTQLVYRILSGTSEHGLRRGTALTKLLQDLYLYHFIDRPFRHLRPGVPLLRTGGQFLGLCSTLEEARATWYCLCALFRQRGLHLTPNLALARLDAGKSARWNGLKIDRVDDGLRYAVTDLSFADLAARLWILRVEHESSGRDGMSRADETPDRTRRVIRDWLGQLGPCTSAGNGGAVYERVVATARSVGRIPLPDPHNFLVDWREVHASWLQARNVCSSVAQRARVDG